MDALVHKGQLSGEEVRLVGRPMVCTASQPLLSGLAAGLVLLATGQRLRDAHQWGGSLADRPMKDQAVDRRC